MYAKYLKERENKEIQETDYGFVIYQVNNDEKYIYAIDVYVAKEHRGRGFGSSLMDFVAKKGKEIGCDKFYTSADRSSLGYENSMLAILNYGKNRKIKYSHTEPGTTLDYYLMEL
jgi:GNAT superfamily N-acetyltransferase